MGADDGASNVQGVAVATRVVSDRAIVATPSAWSLSPNQVRIALVRTIFVILQAATREPPTSYGSPGASSMSAYLPQYWLG
jgi:hypothetical protein